MTNFLALGTTYSGVDVALFRDNICLHATTLCKTQASSLLIPTVHTILLEYNLTLRDLSFFALNKGPGPFTTLRVAIATVNGLSYATGIPIVPVNGLACLLAHNLEKEKVTVVFLNAFARDVYYGIGTVDEPCIEIGVLPLAGALNRIHERYASESVIFCGNVVLEDRFEVRVCDAPRIHDIALTALQLFHEGTKEYQAEPLYLKQLSAVLTPSHRS